MVDTQLKAQHCTMMLLAAATLADCAPEEAQKGALARYSFVFADAGLEWMRIWRNELARSHEPGQQRHANACKPAVRQLAAALGEGDGVRDYLGAKRQEAAALRADDIDATLRLWDAVNPANVREIGKAAIETYDTLADVDGENSVAVWSALPDPLPHEIREALPRRDPTHWHLASDSAAGRRLHTLPAEGGGRIGQRITQINDVAMHLDVLLRLAPIAERALVYDWLVRSAITIELNALLDLTLGAPRGGNLNVVYPLVDLCRGQGREDSGKNLERLRGSIGNDGWGYLRWMRNTIGAHLDRQLRMFEIHRHLVELDYQGVIRLAEYVLDFLDELGANDPGFGLLVLGERRISSWPIDSSVRAPGRPKSAVAGSLANMFRRIDSPYMTVTASSMGSPVVAGIVAGRVPKPREKIGVNRTANRYLDPSPIRLRLRAED